MSTGRTSDWQRKTFELAIERDEHKVEYERDEKDRDVRKSHVRNPCVFI